VAWNGTFCQLLVLVTHIHHCDRHLLPSWNQCLAVYTPSWWKVFSLGFSRPFTTCRGAYNIAVTTLSHLAGIISSLTRVW
jgi:hypothetical protein